MMISRRQLLTASLAGSALLVGGCAARARVTPDGQGLTDGRRANDEGVLVARDGFAFVELDWVDAGRQRAVPVRLYLPDIARAARSPVPLVLFSHGLGGSRRGYSHLGENFARNGIASLHVQHVGSDRGLWVGGSPLELASRLQAAAQDSEALNRVADLRFALDRALDAAAAEAWRFSVDAERIVVAGHSYGANTSLLASGAHVERNGRLVDLRDERFRAALLLSAPPFYGAASMDPILRPVTVPSLHVTTTGDEIRVPGYYSSAADRLAVFAAIGSRSKALAVFNGGSHSIFTDRSSPGGPELNARVKGATQELTLAFLASALNGRDAALRAWPERHREILARFSTEPVAA